MDLSQTAQSAEDLINTLAPIVGAAIPGAAPVVSAIESAETVGAAVGANLAHHTAASDIQVGLTALAATPLVQNSPTVAAKLTGLALIWQDILKDFGITK